MVLIRRLKLKGLRARETSTRISRILFKSQAQTVTIHIIKIKHFDLTSSPSLAFSTSSSTTLSFSR